MDKIFNKPFAVNGTRTSIPENGTESDRVSFDKGFTQPYEIEAPSVDNPQGQGYNILRPEMNEALYQLSSACNILAENIDKWTALTNENLNNIIEKGRYFQPTQSQATTANNYPVNEAGYLIVLNSVNGNVTQFYKVANSNDIFTRFKNGNEWNAWDKIILKSEFETELNKKEDKLSVKSWGGGGQGNQNTNFTILKGYTDIRAGATIMTNNIPCDGTAITANIKLIDGTFSEPQRVTISNPVISGTPSIPRTIVLWGRWVRPASSENRVVYIEINISRGSVVTRNIQVTQAGGNVE